MKMHWKWILGVLFALCLVLILVVCIILWRYDFNDLKPAIIEIVENKTGREFSIKGDMDLRISLSPALVVEDISFQNASWGSRPEMISLKRLELKIALIPLITGKIMVNRLIAIEPDIIIERDKAGRSNLEFRPADETEKKLTASEDLSLPVFLFDEIEIQKGRLMYRDGQSGRTYEIDLETLSASRAMDDNRIELLLKGAYGGRSFEVNGTMGPFTAIADLKEAFFLNLTAGTDDLTVTLDGSIRDLFHAKGLDIRFTAQGSSILTLAEFAEVKELPDMGPFNIDCKVAGINQGEYDISNLTASLGENRIKGSIQLGLNGERPEVNAVLSSERLDLRSLLEKGKGEEDTGKAASEVEKGERIFKDDPIPFDFLGSADARIRLGVEELFLPWLALRDLDMGVDLKDSLMKVHPLRAEMGGGIFDGLLILDNRNEVPLHDATIKIESLDLGLMLKDLEYDEIVEGKLDLDLGVKGRGDSMATIMAGLDGKVLAVMGEGSVNNKYMELLGADLGSGILRLINPSKDAPDYTRIHCFVSSMDIDEGLADVSALVMDTPLMTTAGKGKINLKTEELDISLEPSPKKGVAGFSLSFAELTKPFRLSGTLANPSLGIDPAKAALMLGKAVGGVMLFGPAGILAAMAGTTSGEENPCLAAIEAAEKGVKTQEEKEPAKEKSIVEKTKESVGGTLKKLFGQ